MENKAKAGVFIGIGLAIIVIAYLYSQGWFAQVIPYFEKFFRVI
ncbi:MAG: hypothetical protein ACP5UN_03845 [Candidatus Micrarchaeia archaeon]